MVILTINYEKLGSFIYLLTKIKYNAKSNKY